MPIPKQGKGQRCGAICAYSEAVGKIMSKSAIRSVIGGAAMSAAVTAFALLTGGDGLIADGLDRGLAGG